MYLKLSARLLQQQYAVGCLGKNFVGVFIDDSLTVFGSQSEFIVKIGKNTRNASRSHCVIHRETLGFRTLFIAIKDKLAAIILAVNYVKASAVNTKLFIKLCKDIDSNHETLLFYTFVR